MGLISPVGWAVVEQANLYALRAFLYTLRF